MNIGTIKEKIAEDKAKTANAYRRYPIRFLFMEMNNNTQNEIEVLIKSTGGELLELSDYIMNKDDGWMTRDRLIRVIKNKTSLTKDTYVLGFSELIRFFSKKQIETTILSLFDIENSNTMDPKLAQRRIYFICFSMVDNVSKVLQNSFARKDLIDPFINLDYEFSGVNREICFVANDFTANIKTNKIQTSVDWLGLWRHSEIIDFNLPIWCCSESLYEWYKKASPDNAFQIDIVKNPKDYLKKVYDLTIDIPYEEEDVAFWNQLFVDYTKAGRDKSLSWVVGHVLMADSKSMSALAGKYLTTEILYEQWLIKCYVNAYYQKSYLSKVLSLLQSNSKKEFLAIIWQQGYLIDDKSQLEERVSIIKELNKYAEAVPPEKEIQEAIYNGISKELDVEIETDNNLDTLELVEISEKTKKDIMDLRKRLQAYYACTFKPAFTGLSNTEKEFVINFYANSVVDKAEIKSIYPVLSMYLFSKAENYIEGMDEWKYYLQAYRESKVANRDNPYIQNYYKNGCANAANLYNMYYEIGKQETLIAPYADESNIYILDGVGAEYLPLIVELVKENGYDVQSCNYAVCHLPSITDVNKEYLSGIPYKEWFLDFDRKVVHGEYYKTSSNLRKAFDILKTKIKDIIAESYGRRIVITADHGATARARWTDTKKKYDFSGSDHEGRCYKVPDGKNYENTVDYIFYEDEIKPGTPYIISLNDQSLYNKPKYEDHGGATVEEILVPVIVAAPHDSSSIIIYKVLSNNLEVSGLDKIVSFIIKPDPKEECYVMEADRTKHVLRKVNSVYEAELNIGKEQEITVVVDDKEYKFHTESKAKKNMEGDDGFDD